MTKAYNAIANALLSIGSDKYLHLTVCLIIAFGLTLAFGCWIYGAIATLFIAICIKEVLIDLIVRQTYVDEWDILADFLGVAIGVALAIL